MCRGRVRCAGSSTRALRDLSRQWRSDPLTEGGVTKRDVKRLNLRVRNLASIRARAPEPLRNQQTTTTFRIAVPWVASIRRLTSRRAGAG
jgi:hypothetical protein